MQYPVITCVNAIYAAIFGDKTMIFTQDSIEAKEVGEELGLHGVPNWWDEFIPVTTDNINDVVRLFGEMYSYYGNGMCEFIRIHKENRMEPRLGDTIILSGFTIN